MRPEALLFRGTEEVVSFDVIGPELGAGEYAWRLFGPLMHDEWGVLYEGVGYGSSPREVADCAIRTYAGSISALDCWQVQVYDNPDADDARPILLGTWIDPAHVARAVMPAPPLRLPRIAGEVRVRDKLLSRAGGRATVYVVTEVHHQPVGVAEIHFGPTHRWTLPTQQLVEAWQPAIGAGEPQWREFRTNEWVSDEVWRLRYRESGHGLRPDGWQLAGPSGLHPFPEIAAGDLDAAKAEAVKVIAAYWETDTSAADYPAPGSQIPGQPGYVVGTCLHRMAGSEWRAGLRVCEHCPTPDEEQD